MIIVRNYMKLKVFPVLVILLFGTPAFADFKKGWDFAYKNGGWGNER